MSERTNDLMGTLGEFVPRLLGAAVVLLAALIAALLLQRLLARFLEAIGLDELFDRTGAADSLCGEAPCGRTSGSGKHAAGRRRDRGPVSGDARMWPAGIRPARPHPCFMKPKNRRSHTRQSDGISVLRRPYLLRDRAQTKQGRLRSR